MSSAVTAVGFDYTFWTFLAAASGAFVGTVIALAIANWVLGSDEDD